jgi:hypothetical protein
MAAKTDSLASLADRQFGRREAKLLLRNAPSRVLGILLNDGHEWQKAFEHIRAHFHAAPGKERHSRFRNRYCTEEAVRELIRRAVAGPSRTAEYSQAEGRPHDDVKARIERDFADGIGTDYKGVELCTLAVFVDRHGRLVSAYPIPRDATT